MRTPRPRLRRTAAVASAVLLAACTYRKADAASDSAAAVAAARASSSAAARERPGEVHITTPNNGLVLALAGDSVSMGLSDSVLALVRTATDSANRKVRAETDGKAMGGFGAMIANTVTSAVSGALATHVSYPLSDIQDVRYEDGAIHFDYRPGARHALSFESVKVDDRRPALASFAPADAQRFVAAVHAAKARR